MEFIDFRVYELFFGTIGKSAFYNCVSLKGKLNFPSSHRYIGDSAFAECTGLTGRLTIPKSVENID